MRILHCVPSMAGGGGERQLTYLAKELVQLGWDVHVALIHGGPNLSQLEATGATVHHIQVLGNHDPQILFRLVRIIRAVKPDVVHCWLLQMEVLGGLAASLTRTPWVVSELASEEAYPRTFKMWLRRTIGRRSTAIVSNSKAGDQYWEALTKNGPKRYIIPTGVPLEKIANAPKADPQDTNVTGTGPILLNAARFEYQKNFETFMRALQLVTLERPVQAICCGEGSLRNTVEQLAGGLGLEACVRFPGYTSDLWGLMKRADVLVSTSFFEGCPNVVLEAMACGCPLIVSDIPTHREILDEETAVFIDPNSPGQIADTIVAVLNDPDGAARRARCALARVQHYSLAAVARQFARVYGDISTGDHDRATAGN